MADRQKVLVVLVGTLMSRAFEVFELLQEERLFWDKALGKRRALKMSLVPAINTDEGIGKRTSVRIALPQHAGRFGGLLLHFRGFCRALGCRFLLVVYGGWPLCFHSLARRNDKATKAVYS